MAAVSDDNVVMVLDHIVIAEKTGNTGLITYLSCSSAVTTEFKNKAARDKFYTDLVTALKAVPTP